MPDNGTQYTLTPEDEALLSYLPEEDRPKLAARLAATAVEDGPRSPRPDRAQGADPTRRPATEAAEAKRSHLADMFEDHAAPMLRGFRT